MTGQQTQAVLLGDSIFDNGIYVGRGQAVIDALHRELPVGSAATLLARDGAVTAQVVGQLSRLKAGHTHLFVSTGGNDALGAQFELQGFASALDSVTTIRAAFRSTYRAMLKGVLASGRAVTVCTIYDQVPGLEENLRTALAVFNEVILFEAVRVGVPVIDLRVLCDEPEDYSDASPIEPSAQASVKMARAIRYVLRRHDFSSPQCVVYGKQVLA